jgi:hypothetical protein
MASSSYTGSRDHIAAAEQLEKAAQCHREAARLFESGDARKGAEQAQMAQSFEAKAQQHGSAAAQADKQVNRQQG